MEWSREFEVTSPWTIKLAIYNAVINGIESIIGEWGCKSLWAVIDEDKVTICYDYCDGIPDQGFELDDAVSNGIIKEYELRQCNMGKPLNELYVEAARMFIKNSMSMMNTYALRTRFDNIEYMLIILQNGRAALLQGEHNRVVIPQIRASATAHTHPRGCTPSPHDIRSLINLLFDGGLGSGIVSTDCSLYIMREGPYTENDLIALSKLRDDLSARDVNAVKAAFKKGIIGDNLRVYVF